MRLLLCLLMLMCLSGCIYNPPNQLPEFRKISHLRELNGVYANHDKNGYCSLSSIIWGDEAGFDNSSISRIEVSADDADASINVKAWRENELKKESVFLAGKQFEFHSGQIVLKSGTSGYVGDGGLGIGASSVALGLDVNGQGKYQRNEAGAVMAMFIVPIAIRDGSECSFERIDAR